ncbi:MAG: response regulator transcription factor [Acidobacteriota bacterium]
MIRVLIADAHEDGRCGARCWLEHEQGLEIVGEANDGQSAVEMTEKLHPSVVVMDVSLRQANGQDASAEILRKHPEVDVILLSMRHEEGHLIRAVSNGARGFLLKEGAELDLVHAVRSVSEGKPFFSPAVTRILIDEFRRRHAAA